MSEADRKMAEVNSSTFGDLSRPDYVLGEAAARALARAGEWRHRKVESLRLLEAEKGRRRVSLDCTPPADLVLASGGEQILVLPLALITKGPMKDFDISDSEGVPLSLLGRSDDGYFAWSAACFLLRRDLDRPLSCREERALHRIVHEPADGATIAAVELLGGKAGLDLGKVSDQTFNLLFDLASRFVLLCAISGGDTSRRIIKYSYHWTIPMQTRKARWRDRFLAAFGFRPALFELNVAGAADVGSYHLEVHAPPGLITCGLELPGGADFDDGRYDAGQDAIAHAVASYRQTDPAQQEWIARLALRVPARGLRTATFVISLVTFVIFLLQRSLPGAERALLDAADGAVALLLVVPAAYGLFAARSAENIMVSALLLPLRMTMLTCSALLLAAAGSLVGHLQEPWITGLWVLGLVVSSVLLVAQICAWVKGTWSDESVRSGR